MPGSFREGEIKGVVVCKLTKALDSRGWLAELFRNDGLSEEFFRQWPTSPRPIPASRVGLMSTSIKRTCSVLSVHRISSSVWDNRKESETFGFVSTVVVGEDNPASVIVPAGVVHAYQNVGPVEGIVINCPNRLYRGPGRKEEIDEIRHESDPGTIFRMDD